MERHVKSGVIAKVEDILMQLSCIDIMRTSAIFDPQQVIMLRGVGARQFIVAIDGREVRQW